MALLIQWTWTWANFRRWWGTEKPGTLKSLGLQRVGHDLKLSNNPWGSAVPDSVRGRVLKEVSKALAVWLLATWFFMSSIFCSTYILCSCYTKLDGILDHSMLFRPLLLEVPSLWIPLQALAALFLCKTCQYLLIILGPAQVSLLLSSSLSLPIHTTYPVNHALFWNTTVSAWLSFGIYHMILKFSLFILLFLAFAVYRFRFPELYTSLLTK